MHTYISFFLLKYIQCLIIHTTEFNINTLNMNIVRQFDALVCSARDLSVLFQSDYIMVRICVF